MRATLMTSAVLVWLCLPGCANTNDPAAAKAEPRTYVTGSNIARRADQPTGSPTYGASGEEIRANNGQLPILIPRPEGHRGTGN